MAQGKIADKARKNLDKEAKRQADNLRSFRRNAPIAAAFSGSIEPYRRLALDNEAKANYGPRTKSLMKDAAKRVK